MAPCVTYAVTLLTHFSGVERLQGYDPMLLKLRLQAFSP